MNMAAVDPDGSSPLARGLPDPTVADDAVARIIPARAGFTTKVIWENVTREDHPRSRGVYRRGVERPHDLLGSSPLARGLPGVPEWAADLRGIIPARAGFTPCALPATRTTSDHPRSRGVYPRGLRWCAAVRGSSPLARGLRPGADRRVPARGIIPARAGFTPGAP